MTLEQFINSEQLEIDQALDFLLDGEALAILGFTDEQEVTEVYNNILTSSAQ